MNDSNRQMPGVPKMDPANVFRPHLGPAERLEWSAIAGPVAATGVQRLFSFVLAGSLALIVTVFVGVEGVLPGLALPVLFIAVFLLSLFASRAFTRRAGSQPRAYGISDRRVLVHVDGTLQSFGPGEISTLEVDRQPDGSVDLFWGWKDPTYLDRGRYGEPEGANPMKFHVRSRTERIGFVGLASEEPARTLISQLVQRHYDAAASAAEPSEAMAPLESASHAAAVAPALSNASIAGKPSAAATAPGAGWLTLREPASGLAIDLPGDWETRIGLLKRTRVLGVLIESPETKWFDSPGSGWNRLEAKPAADSAALQVDLDPPNPPADLAAVASDKWSTIANVTLLDTHPDLRIGGLVGFGVTQSLKGAGIGAGAFGSAIRSRPIWSRSRCGCAAPAIRCT